MPDLRLPRKEYDLQELDYWENKLIHKNGSYLKKLHKIIEIEMTYRTRERDESTVSYLLMAEAMKLK